MRKMKVLAICAIAVFATTSVKAQFATGADVVSSYVWRGVPQDRSVTGNPTLGSPNIQPYVSFTTGKLTIGSWASSSFLGNVKEVDLNATYAFSSALALTVTDYNWGFSKSYFSYGTGTDHIYEASLAYTGAALSASVNTMFAGADKLENGNNAFSTYAEVGYQISPVAKVFLGASLTESPLVYYTKGFGVTNVGIKVSKSIAITDKFSLPVYGIVGANPYSGGAFFVAGITL
ncbi:MAG: hypothetical protein Q8904_08860 [Bacteroidota bacterium]|nr:hypothetical protein [Bacteroidota bacterium]